VTRKELDTLWHQALHESVVAGEDFIRYHFAAKVAAAECEKVAQWMIQRSYATGHGDAIEDLLKELEWQVRESEREACARLCEKMETYGDPVQCWLDQCAAAIRTRGEA
jgi:hypothetical protein